LEHANQNFLEVHVNKTVLAELLCVRVEFEEIGVSWLVLKVSEVFVRILGTVKWRSTESEDEHKDTKRENVRVLTVARLDFCEIHFRSHVGLGSHYARNKFILWGGETKVTYFQLSIVTDKHVF